MNDADTAAFHEDQKRQEEEKHAKGEQQIEVLRRWLTEGRHLWGIGRRDTWVSKAGAVSYTNDGLRERPDEGYKFQYEYFVTAPHYRECLVPAGYYDVYLAAELLGAPILAFLLLFPRSRAGADTCTSVSPSSRSRSRSAYAPTWKLSSASSKRH